MVRIISSSSVILMSSSPDIKKTVIFVQRIRDLIRADQHAAKLKLSCHEVRRQEEMFCILVIMEMCTELSVQQTMWKEKINE